MDLDKLKPEYKQVILNLRAMGFPEYSLVNLYNTLLTFAKNGLL